MTDNEAIKQLQIGYLGDTEDLVQAKHIAIQAFEEIKQYRAIGTVDDVKATYQLCEKLGKLVDAREGLIVAQRDAIEHYKGLKESNCKYWNAEHEDCALSYEEIRANAIDEFVEAICNKAYKKNDFITMRIGYLKELAEQMKEGAE